MSEFVNTYRGTVYPWQCDHMGHMNVMWYAAKFDEACWQLLANLGFTAARFREQGVGMAAVEQHTKFERELIDGDAISIRSTIVDVQDKSLRLFHEMKNDVTGEVVATSTVVGVHIDAQARKARSLPTDVRSRALLMLEGKAGLRV